MRVDDRYLQQCSERKCVPDAAHGIAVSIVLPCINEAETLASCIAAAKAGIAASGLEGEIIVADNGSKDESVQIARSLGAETVAVAERGYGSALRGGIAAARGRYVVMGDADASYDFFDVPRFVEQLDHGYDLVMGNRFRGGIEPGAMPWKHRYLGNPVLSGLGRLFFRCPVGDFHCGLRAFSRDAYDRMELPTTGMEFASEMVIKAVVKGLRVAEVPTRLHPDGRSRPPHLRSWRDGWRHLRLMMLFSPTWLFLFPGGLCLLLGLIGMAVLSTRGLALGAVHFGMHTLLVCGLAVLLGQQLIVFALFVKQLGGAFGLHPTSGVLYRRIRRLALEHGVVAGLLVSALGLGGLMFEAWKWKLGGFGPLDPQTTMLAVVRAIVSTAAGVQMVFASFLIGYLELVRARIGMGGGR